MTSEREREVLWPEHSYQDLRNMKWLATRFGLSWRHDNPTWEHHKTVATLAKIDMDEAQDWLRRAADQQWTVAQLKAELHRRAYFEAQAASLNGRDGVQIRPAVYAEDWPSFLNRVQDGSADRARRGRADHRPRMVDILPDKIYRLSGRLPA